MINETRERVFVLAAVLLAGMSTAAEARSWDTDILAETFGYGPGDTGDVPYEEIQQGCGARDCIPSIDRPKFVPAAEADFISDSDLVLAIRIGDDARAYPIAILNYHEIVNDTIGGRPIAVTYCPLCGSGMAFDRAPGGKITEFGVSGLLRNNDLILYDRASESLWQQITGEAFAGPQSGSRLEAVPVTLTQWSRWKTAHPQTRVLSTDTGFAKPYVDKTPYGNYDTSQRLLFPISFDRRLHPKTVVHGVEIGEQAFAVTEEALIESGSLEQPGEPGIRWSMGPGGEVTAIRLDSGEAVVSHRMFWFAWYSFHTATALLD